ncbi:MFS transporter [Porphyromonas macacae]|uniref:MFS transporter n=1 Tax=Porphyromonas macacae TaxID=28115 RepID=UPI0024AE542B|nr:MFS transporter [Porphyromonas macacae]
MSFVKSKVAGKSISPIRWVPSTYFAMGLPYVTISIVALIMLNDFGMPNDKITFWTSLLVLPWSLKPFFSVVMELVGSKKMYVVVTELICSVVFGLVAFSMPLPDFYSLIIALLAVMAFSGSMHDIAGDGLYMAELSTDQQSKFVGWQGAFYNLAKILANGGLIYLAGIMSRQIGIIKSWMVIMVICAVLMAVIALYHMAVMPSGKRNEHQEKKTFSAGMAELWLVIKTFFQKKYIWYYLIFIILYRFAEGLATKVAPLFLKAPVEQGGIGLTNEQYGLIYGTGGALAFIVGSILGGYYISRFGLRKVLFSLALIFNVPFVVYLLLALFRPTSLWWIGSGVVFEYFTYGFGFVGLTLFMMQQIAPGKYQMAHYAFATSIMNLGVMLPGMISGKLSLMLGYRDFFIVVMIATIPALILTYFVPFTHKEAQETVK